MQTKIELQKSVADTVLNKLQLLDRNCIVAGGAPRDWFLGNPATDIDVYLYDSRTTYVYAEQRSNLLSELGFNIQSKCEDWKLPELYQSNHYVKHLYDCEFLGEKVQVIFVKEPTFISVVDTFPISISKIWYKNEKIRTTPDFLDSVKHKILWKTVDSYKEDNKYIAKIKAKFSNYKYVTKKEVEIIRTFANNLEVFSKEELLSLLLAIKPNYI